MVEFNVKLVVDPGNSSSSVAGVENALHGVEERVSKVGQLAKSAFAALGAALAVREIADVTDEYNNLQNRLRVVTNSTAELASVTGKLFEVANATRSSYQATGELYARLAISAKELGATQGQLIQLTESLNQAIILSGASAQEASAGSIQLSQGLASGALRGDELRSVLEQLPAVADVIAKHLGVTRGQLRELGQDGKITSQIILDAFAAARVELGERFAKTVPTIGQSLTVLRNQFASFVGNTDQVTGASKVLSTVILSLANNLDVVAVSAAAAGAVMATRLAPGLVTAAVSGAGSLVNALKLVSPVALAGAVGVGALVGVTAGLVTETSKLRKEIEDAGKAVEGSALTAYGALGQQINNAQKQAKALQGVLSKAPDNTAAQQALAGITMRIAQLRQEQDKIVESTNKARAAQNAQSKDLQDVNRELETQLRLLQFTGQEADVQSKLAATFDKLAKAGVNLTQSERTEIEQRIRAIETRKRENDVIEAIRGEQDKESERLKTLAQLLDAGRISQEEYNRATGEGVAATNTLGASIGTFLDGVGQAIDMAVQTADRWEKVNVDIIAPLMQQKEILDALAQGNVELARAREIQLAAQQMGVDLTEEETQRILALEQANQSLALQGQILGQITGPQQQYQQGLEAINALIAKNPDLQDQLIAKLREYKIAALDASTSAEAGFERAFLKLTQEANDFASATERGFNILVDTGVDALTSLVQTGNANFRELALNAVNEIQKIILRLLVLKAIEAVGNAIFPGAGSVAGAAAGAATPRASGGPVQPGQAYLVGERGPEPFVPRSAGTIFPASSMQQAPAQPAPPPQITVVNVTDEDQVAAYIGSGRADSVIINRVIKNRDKIRGAL